MLRVLGVRERHTEHASRCIDSAERLLRRYIMSRPRAGEARLSEDDSALDDAVAALRMAGRIENNYQGFLKQAGLLAAAAAMPRLVTHHCPGGQTFFQLADAARALRHKKREEEDAVVAVELLIEALHDASWRCTTTMDLTSATARIIVVPTPVGTAQQQQQQQQRSLVVVRLGHHHLHHSSPRQQEQEQENNNEGGLRHPYGAIGLTTPAGNWVVHCSDIILVR